MARPAVRRREQGADVQRLALHPGGEGGRGEQGVEGHGEREALLRRDRRSPGRRRPRAPGAAFWMRRSGRSRLRSRPSRPGVLEDRREQDVLAACRGSASTPTRPSRALDGARAPARAGPPRPRQPPVGAAQRGEDGDRQAGVRARRVEAQLGARLSGARCGRRPGPSRRGPRARPSAVFGGEFVRRDCPCGAPRRRSPRARSPAGASAGKVSSRLPRSPLGSMRMAGTPSRAASSSRARHRPVLPEPVMPTQTACVVRSLASS